MSCKFMPFFLIRAEDTEYDLNCFPEVETFHNSKFKSAYKFVIKLQDDKSFDLFFHWVAQ